MDVFFTSDEHLGHQNIIKFCNRPFSSLEEMFETLIERHNSKVGPNDSVYHLGDGFWRTLPEPKALEYVSRLNGLHYYVCGNHEELFNSSKLLQNKFIILQPQRIIHPEGWPKRGITLNHFPLRSWEQSHRGAWHLYGHEHGTIPLTDPTLSLDVGVDVHDYYPISLDEVRKIMQTKADAIALAKSLEK